MMPRVFWPLEVHVRDVVCIDGEEGHHFVRVLRTVPGENLALAASNGPFLARVETVETKKGTLTVTVLESLAKHEPRIKVYLVQGLAKGDKIEEVVQKCTEIGIAGVLIVETERSVVRLSGAKTTNKQERWQRVAAEAASQSQRDAIPSVEFASSLEAAYAWLQKCAVTVRLVLDEDEQALGLKKALELASTSNPPDTVVSIAIFVGPEGGWSDAERNVLLTVYKATAVTLGPRILRTETAGPAALSAILYAFGELGG